MGFKCGIVGLPNVGKSTLFNALTQAGIEAANYPFCTIEPNVGMVEVPDLRLQALANIVKPERVVPTTLQFVDIAGLVAGASKGEGLGNQFLAHIRETEAIAHVVRCFENDDVTHVSGHVDPIRDIEIIQTELILADISVVEKRLQRVTKLSKSGDKTAKAEHDILLALHEHLNDGNQAITFQDQAALTIWPSLQHLITSKKVMYIANVDEAGLNDDNAFVTALKERANAESASVVTICANIEAELVELDEADKREFLQSLNLDEPGLNRVIRAGYDLLHLQTFFTAGPKEVHAWTVAEGALAPQAAGVIHTDFEKGFIRAEVISYDDFITYQGETGAKEAGKWRLEGKDYIMQEGDVLHFRFNV